MADVMISYSRKDVAFVQQLHQELANLGRDVWVDFEDIPKTADWWQEIRRGIEEADNFAFVISPDSVESEVCGWEIQHAIELKKRLIPVLHRDITEPETKAKMRQELNAHNWIFARPDDDFKKAFDDFIKAMDTDLVYVRNHTRLLTRAIEWDKSQRDNSLLLRGNDLYMAETWLKHAAAKTPPPDELHTAYVKESRRVVNASRRTFIMGTAITLLVTMLAIFSIWQAMRAENQRQLAVEAERGSRALALASNAQLSFENGRQDIAIALAIESNNISPQIATLRALANVGYAPGTRLFMRINSPVASSAISPDGRYAVTGSDDAILRVWDLENGKIVTELSGHENAVWGLAFSPDGERLVSGSEDGTLKVWDFGTGEVLQTLWGHEAAVWDVAFAPDGKTFASGDFAGKIILWDAETYEPIVTFEGHQGPVWSVRYSPDSTQLLSGGEDRRVMLWSVTNRELVRRYSVHRDVVTDVAFAPLSNNFYSVSRDTSLVEWSLQGQQELGFAGQRHTEPIVSMAVSPDGTRLATGSRDNRVIVWDLERKIPTLIFTGHFGTVATVAFSPDSKHLLSGAEDGTIRYWDLQNGAIAAIYQGRRSDMWSVAFTRDNKYIIGNNDMHLIDYQTGQQVGSYSFSENVNQIEFSQDGELLVGGAENGHVYIWDTDTYQLLQDFDKHNGHVWMALFTPDAESVISGAEDGTVYLWDVDTGEVIREFVGHKGSAWTGSISPDGSLLTTASDMGELFLWDVATGEQIRTFATEETNFNQLESALEIYEVTFSHDGKMIATGDTNNLVRVWDVETGELLQLFDGHRGLVSTVAFSSDNSILISGGYDNELIMWDVDEGFEIRRFTGHTNSVTDANISPDGKLIVSGTNGGVLRVWYVHSQEELLDWVKDNRHVHRPNCFEQTLFGFEAQEDCTEGALRVRQG